MVADSGVTATSALTPTLESLTEKEAVNGMFGEDFWSVLTSQSFPKAVPNNTPPATSISTSSQIVQDTTSTPKLDRWEIYKNWLISQINLDEVNPEQTKLIKALMKVYELEGRNFSDAYEMGEYHKYLELKDKFEKS